MLAFWQIRPVSPATTTPPETARALQYALALRGIHADLVNDQKRVRLSLSPGLVAVVQDDGIWWHSPRMLHPGIPLYVHRCTVAGAAEALAADHALLRSARNPDDAALA
ncbi:hypothetical protein C1I98_12890 [Spongiactinospora gelatinilytica]|uniref:Uncharacterized protein n=1 Tax=Spongiactinospora gelatinilytica TaxID=2666298 RepID=A0A2W2GJR6_9ACTN|nr:hypothetical protein [Spongiactinospora gelatinilytica]PZG48092.1 hypothetical protein C1I98_12890 [Spongiactinospora gelatinilytica]